MVLKKKWKRKRKVKSAGKNNKGRNAAPSCRWSCGYYNKKVDITIFETKKYDRDTKH